MVLIRKDFGVKSQICPCFCFSFKFTLYFLTQIRTVLSFKFGNFGLNFPAAVANPCVDAYFAISCLPLKRTRFNFLSTSFPLINVPELALVLFQIIF